MSLTTLQSDSASKIPAQNFNITAFLPLRSGTPVDALEVCIFTPACRRASSTCVRANIFNIRTSHRALASEFALRLLGALTESQGFLDLQLEFQNRGRSVVIGLGQ